MVPKSNCNQWRRYRMNILAIDIGGSSIKAAFINNSQQLSLREKIATPMTSKEDLLTALESLIRSYDDIDGLAISMPGVIDSQQGFLYTGGALRYLHPCPFADELAKLFHLPVWIGNDARCAAIAEVGYGVLQEVNDAIVVILGTGIGGCLIKDKNIHYGKHFRSSEVSSIHTDYHTPFQIDANWWAVSGIQALSTIAQKHLQIDEHISGELLFSYIEQGSEVAKDALREFCTTLALQLFNLQAIFDAETIAIGGGISQQSLLIEYVKEAFQKIVVGEPIYTPHITACKFHNDANLWGAYYQFLQTYQ